jgi:hypothetical protein
VVEYNGSSWTTAGELQPSSTFPGFSNAQILSCTTTEHCVGVGSGAASFDPLSLPQQTTAIPPVGDLTSVSCTSATFCAAVDAHGHAQTFDGTNWAPAVLADSSANPDITSVSCVSTSFCMAVDNTGNADNFNGTVWSTAPINAGSPMLAVSCRSTTFCIAVDGFNSYLYNGSTWSAPTLITGSTGSVTAVSCAPTAICVAVDSLVGAAFTYDGNVWTPASPDPDPNGGGLTAVSCPLSTFCTAVDNRGFAITYNGTSWTLPTSVSASPLTGVSCVAATFCTAVDAQTAYKFDGTSWSKFQQIDTDFTAQLTSVSCTS